jgi:uncharacterized membrane protein YdjX (TVP38/TMEM64 family)
MSTTEQVEIQAEDNKSGAGKKLIILLVIIAAGFGTLQFTSFGEYVQPERLKVFFDSIAKFWWAPLAYIGIYAVGTVVGAPGLLLTIVGGLTFGTVYGTLYVLVGANIGANLAFGLSRSLGREFVAKHVKGPIDAIDRQLHNQGLLRMIQLRLIPVIPFNILNFASGLSGIRHIHYFLGTLLGMIPGVFVYVYSASALAQLYFSGADVDEVTQAAARTTAIINFSIAIGLLVLVSLIPVIYRKIKREPVDELVTQ